ncbi:uncharacterized protein EV154DRAFT_505148 [Mucor mucedo]|uniref:uncharacterized protein n=1 Tax=Mucor mucedo TaxID=29922 RepID=UPI002221285C|nr:uncharacterized protein EV154DRAFT_505148 [Mucor mucedo]KAI7892438.1 hypothetical protein EV154DRAFT_505148 [Mucor mucedo]
MSDTVKVAVIGSGLAGLSAAYLLTQGHIEGDKKFEVHVFEKNTELGMDAASISVGPEKDFRIDVPMRSYMSGYYSHLSKLYEHLDIPAKKANFSFGWYRIMQSAKKRQSSIDPSQVASYTDHNSYLVYSGARTVGYLDMVTSNTITTFWDYLTEIGNFLWRAFVVAMSYVWIMAISLYFHHAGHLTDPDHSICNMTLGDFFKTYKFHPFFVHEIFVPLFAAVCTNSYDSMLKYPASDILEYMAVGLFQESYIVACGVQRVVQTISAPLKHVHLNTQIMSIQPNKTTKFRLIDEHGENYDVDHIIFATQGNQAISMLQAYTNALKEQSNSLQAYTESVQSVQLQMDMLKKFHYDSALVINHTDTRLLPTDPSNWRALNLAIVDKSVDPGESHLIVPFPHDTTMATHILNMTHSSISKGSVYMQTTNPCLAVDPKKILSVTWFERATVTLQSKRALQDLFQTTKDESEPTLGPCQGKNGIWFVGSYCWKGIPLLEGCVASAESVVTKGIAVAENITIQLPY